MWPGPGNWVLSPLTTLAMTLLCLSWKVRKRNLFTEVHTKFLSMANLCLQHWDGNPDSFTFFCMHARFHCTCIVLFRPRLAIQSHSKVRQFFCFCFFFLIENMESLEWLADPKILARVNFLSDKGSYTIHISSVAIHLNNKGKNLLNNWP